MARWEQTGAVRVLEADLALADPLSPREFAAARRALIAQRVDFARGPLEEPIAEAKYVDGHGLLILSGFILREVTVGSSTAAELLGPGDLLRPGEGRALEASRLPVSWTALARLRMAVLDRRFRSELRNWPTVETALLERTNQRIDSVSYHLAFAGLPRLEDRLLYLLWHMADRWGRVTRDGTLLGGPFTHDVLAKLTATRRPSVTTALGALSSRGEVCRSGGGWLLAGRDPTLREGVVEVHARGRA